jgi:hypothetical protein
MKRKIKKTKRSETPDTMKIPCKDFLSRVGLSQSLILAFDECRRKFLFKANGYRPLDKKDKYLFGSVFHEALDKTYNGKFKTWVKFEEFFREKKMHEFATVNEQQVELDFALCEIMLEAYIEYYPEDFTDKKFDGVEEEFEIMFEGAKLRGKKDGRFYIDKKRWMMEHKTKSRYNEDALMLVLSFDFQNLMYILADETEYQEPIAGTLYNVIRKPQLRKGKTETLVEFCERVREDVKKRPEWYFTRWEVPYTRKDKERFKHELKQKLSAIELAVAQGSFYKCPKACTGMYTCEYLPSCAANAFINLEKKTDIFPELDKTTVII